MRLSEIPTPALIVDALDHNFSKFVPKTALELGERVRVWPAHVDPTVAYHERMYVVDDEQVTDVLPVDLRGW